MSATAISIPVDKEVLREVRAANAPKLMAIAVSVQQAIARSSK